MYKVTFYVPTDHKEPVKAAVFHAGGGRIGDYDQCCWEVKGTGQFRPLAGATPAIGDVGTVEVVEEYRVEFVCAPESLKAVIRALLAAHPYEEPAYDVVAMVAC